MVLILNDYAKVASSVSFKAASTIRVFTNVVTDPRSDHFFFEFFLFIKWDFFGPRFGAEMCGSEFFLVTD